TLPSGTLNRIRLRLDGQEPMYVVTRDGASHPLRGTEKTLKIDGPWEVLATGGVALNLSSCKSIWVHPRGDDTAPWVLRPTVHACVPTGIERSDYTLTYTTSGMPDSQFDGRSASLR